MGKEDHYRKLENMMHSASIIKHTGARAAISKGRAEITIPVSDQFFHAAGALHGCIYFMALDNAAYFAVNSLVLDAFVLTTSFTVYFTRPVSDGEIRAVGTVLNRHPRQYVGESILYHSNGKEIGRGSGTFVKSRQKLTEDIGYK